MESRRKTANVSHLQADYEWIGSEVDWDQREEHRDRVYDKFIVPVAKYLHEKGYFGFTGMVLGFHSFLTNKDMADIYC
jgi:hypothetical protein